MKRRITLIEQLLPHVCIILSVVLLTFFITDRFNEAMAFINNDMTKWMLGVLCVCSFIVSVLLCVYQRRDR